MSLDPSLSRRRGRSWAMPVGLAVGVLLLGVPPACLILRDTDDPAAIATSPCLGCHGTPSRAGPVAVQAAPPFDLDGNTSPSFPGVGAHEEHVGPSAQHGPVACGECHLVPTDSSSPGHADSARPAEVSFGRLASLGNRTPSYLGGGPQGAAYRCSGTYCHKDYEPTWTAPQPWSCGDCHELPPPPPHDPSEQCSDCHGMVVDAGRGFLRPDLHVNGGVDVIGECYDCHGTEGSNAPPPDLDGETDVSFVGVGAHASHASTEHSAEPVACDSCHVLPETNGAFGHIDDAPGAEVTFGAVALAGGTVPVWDASSRRCLATWCHGPSSPASSSSPEWTAPTGAPLGCDSCHALPPPEPHPDNRDCKACHGMVVGGSEDAWTFVDRALHLNGTVEY